MNLFTGNLIKKTEYGYETINSGYKYQLIIPAYSLTENQDFYSAAE